MNDAVRIAVLSRNSQARDLLRDLLTASGAVIVIQGDPLQVEPGEVIAVSPNVLILSLEPDCDDQVLERWDAVLQAPGLNVIFDEAETSGSLAGWDQSRWARHLTSKALGHEGVLPATPENAVLLTEPVEPVLAPGPVAQADGPVPHASVADTDIGEAGQAASDLWTEFALEQAALVDDSHDDYQVAPELSEAADLSDSLGHDEGLAAVLAQFDARQATDPGIDPLSEPGIEDIEKLPCAASELRAGEQPPASLGSASDEGETSESEDSGLHAETQSRPAQAERPEFDFSELSLEPVGDEGDARRVTAPVSTDPVDSKGPNIDFDRLAASFGLSPDQPSRAPAPAESDAPVPQPQAPIARRGAVLVMAGLGGPDAIRRFLTALDVALPVPVLIRQVLAQANHDRLVPQLAKISLAPVRLACADSEAGAGEITLLPDWISPRLNGDIGVAFQPGDGDRTVLEALVGLGDSLVIVLLSGSETGCIKPALACVERGAVLLAQNPEECFDLAAATLAQQNGARTGSPETLAYWVKEHWRS